jgi:hypothetical protein
MSVTTIKVPAAHIDAIRESLLSGRRHSARADEIDRLLEQIHADAAPGSEPRELTASRAVLWSAVYDSVCAAAERLAEDCNEYWRGVVDPSAARARIAEIGERFALLESLGPPPGS